MMPPAISAGEKKWIKDSGSSEVACREFVYGGCLGNGNRFLSQASCDSLCRPRPEVPVCSKPLAEGACQADLKRWGYDKARRTILPLFNTIILILVLSTCLEKSRLNVSQLKIIFYKIY